MAKCTYEAEPISFPCVLEIVNDVRGGKLGAPTFRKLIKQIDSGLALLGGGEDDEVLVVGGEAPPASTEEVCAKIEATCQETSAQGEDVVGAINPERVKNLINLLIKLLPLFI